MNEQVMHLRPSQVIVKSVQYNEYSLYLHGRIGEPDDFMEHFEVYKTANEGDVIRLYITSEGGSLATGMEYIRHMRECDATIIGILGVEVASMASAIALECDEIEVDEMSTMLIHSFSYGAMGTESSIYNQARFNNKLNERWIRNHYEGFLDESRISDVLKGVDVLLDSEEIIECWNRLHQAEGVEGEDVTNETKSSYLEDSIEEAVTKAFKKQQKAVNIFNNGFLGGNLDVGEHLIGSPVMDYAQSNDKESPLVDFDNDK